MPSLAAAMAMAGSFGCGFLSVFLGAIMAGGSLVFTEENFLKVALLVVAAHLPVMVIEGFITAFCVAFLKKVQPKMLIGYGG